MRREEFKGVERNLDAFFILTTKDVVEGRGGPVDMEETLELNRLGRVERLLDVVEAAQVMNVSVYTVRAWIRQGRLKATRLGRLVRVESCEIRRLIEEGRSNSA